MYVHAYIHTYIFYCVLKLKYNYNMPMGSSANQGGSCLQEINAMKKKEMIFTNLTTNTHMQERGALAKSSGQSCGQKLRIFCDIIVFQLLLCLLCSSSSHVDHLRVHQDHVLIFFVIFNLILICLCRNTISREQFQRSRFMETHNS